MNQPALPRNSRRGFTLTELLVVIVTLAILAIVVLPVLAGQQNKAGRVQCAANLRQIYVASMIYANQYRGWLPICTIGGFNSNGKFNILGGMPYSRYVVGGYTPSSPVPTNATPPYSYYQNLGYLYFTGLAGKGQIFYCPDQWGSLLGANAYLPLLTTDSGGVVRSSYTFNPRVIDPTNGNYLRVYQKTSDLPPHKSFAADYFGSGSGVTSSPNQNVTPHFREDSGWNVLFTDGSVQFSRNAQANNLIQNFVAGETQASQIAEYQILDYLELDH